MRSRKLKLNWMWVTPLFLAVLVLIGRPCIAQESSSAADRPPAPDVLDSSSSSSSSSGSSSSSPLMSCSGSSIQQLGNLKVAKTWSEINNVTFNRQALPAGSCLGYEISAADLAGTECATAAGDRYILIEFWQLSSSNGSSSSNSPDPAAGQVADFRVLAAKGRQPVINIGSDNHVIVVPPIRQSDAGMTPVGTFQDDDALIYGRALSRVFCPTTAVVVQEGEPLDAESWYITIANMPRGQPLPGYAIRAACIPSSSSSSSSSSSNATSEGGTTSVPCPVPVPGGKQCNGQGICRADDTAGTVEEMSFCDCNQGFGSWGCQRSLQTLSLNPAKPTVVTVGPGQWGFWEVTLPGPKSSSGTSGPGSAGGTSSNSFAAAAAGLGPGLLGNEVLLLTARRIGVDDGFGGNPLIFLKPFMTKAHNEPSLDGLDNDLVQHSDLRSFQLQLNQHYILTRLPLQNTLSSSGSSSSSNILYSMPRRWYVAVFNSNASRLSEPVRMEITVQYRDLTRQQMVCPFDCSDVGKCVDPLSAQITGVAFRDGSSSSMFLGPLLTATFGAGARSGEDSSSTNTAIGPMQDISPVDAGFQCICDEGFGGLTCEGRVKTLTVGNGEQKLGPEELGPGDWWFYVLTVDQGFKPSSQNLGIQWTVTSLGSRSGNLTNAFISFDQGPMPRQLVGDRRMVPVRRTMTPYTKLLGNGNTPLPLQVKGGQLSPGGTYVVSIYNSDYVVSDPISFTLGFFVMSEQQAFLHPYMSILLGVTAAVILCLAMTLCKRLVMRYGLWPSQWRQRRAAAAAAANGGGGNSLALVLMAQQQSNRGVPPEIYQMFPCRPYAAKDYQQRQLDVAQQQQQDIESAPDQQQRATPAAAAAAAAGSPDHQIINDRTAGTDHLGRLPGGTAIRSVISNLSGLLIHRSTIPPQQQPAVQSAAAAPAAAAVDANTTTAEVLSSKDDELPSCTVCLCEYVADEMVRQLPCGHEFHQACIDRWMTNHGTCPICRAALWHGAFGTDADDSENNSDNENNNPAAIYVHHDMPAGGFRDRGSNPPAGMTNHHHQHGLVTPGVGNPPLRISIDGGGAAAAAAGAGMGGLVSASPAAAAAAGGGGQTRSSSGGSWFGVNAQQPQRLLWHLRLQQQVPAAEMQPVPQQQQQQQQQSETVSSPPPAAAAAEPPDAVPASTADRGSAQGRQRSSRRSSDAGS